MNGDSLASQLVKEGLKPLLAKHSSTRNIPVTFYDRKDATWDAAVLILCSRFAHYKVKPPALGLLDSAMREVPENP